MNDYPNLFFTKARHLKIIRLLNQNQSMEIKDLAEELGISQSTTRRDIEFMEKLGYVKRYFGGVSLDRIGANDVEPPFEIREIIKAKEKKAIGKKAAEMVEEGDCIFIDGGTTTQFMVPYLKQFQNLTVVTCGINVAYELNKLHNITKIILGGQMNSAAHSMTGNIPLDMIETYRFRFDKAFLTANAVSAKFGVTNRFVDRIPLKQRAIELSEKTYLLCDGSKIGKTVLGQIAPVTSMCAIISDSGAPEEEVQLLRDAGVEVIITQPFSV